MPTNIKHLEMIELQQKSIWIGSSEKYHDMFHIVFVFDPSFSFCKKTIVVFLCFYFPPVYSALNSDVPRDPVVNADKANFLLIKKEPFIIQRDNGQWTYTSLLLLLNTITGQWF